MDDDNDSEPLDPRIQNELERLNKASLLINGLENELDNARAKFRKLLTESTQKLECLSKNLGKCIERAKPYYDARVKANEVRVQTHQAAMRYERAMGEQTAARELVELAEQGYETKKPAFDMAWQEMLNHATIKVMDAENERMLSEVEHERMMHLCTNVQDEVAKEYREHKRSVVKSKVYYEMKANFHTSLESQKQSIESLETDVDSAKKLYAKTLRNLEGISEEIHIRRQSNGNTKMLGKREAGVGSESPVPPPMETRRKTIYSNNNTDDEIIISFPPAAPTPRNSRSSVSPDNPIDISGMNITVSRKEMTPPTLLINDMGLEKSTAPDNTDSASQSLNNTNSANLNPTNGVCSRDNKYDDGGSSVETSPVALRHQVKLGSFKLSAKQLLHETSSVDSDSGSVCSFVNLDDAGVANAMTDKYFSGLYEDEPSESALGDYSTLPHSLAQYQQPFNNARQSVSSGKFLAESDLNLDQVLKLLDNSQDESIV
ncbi:SH3 domain-binding protein 5-like [Watersipora subatra]|uniref:SH3 domain-binding protein 5-like n=1 Tax=Watersipora subatra TaxID=2589382 RepID=UPI00355B4724